jgi:hypothetical protein
MIMILGEWFTVEEIESKISEYQTLLDIQHERTQQADRAWQVAHNQPNVIPDLGELIEWLMGEIRKRNVDEWISVKDELPKIPEGKHGISVLVAMIDTTYEGPTPELRYNVDKVMFDGEFKYVGEWTVPCDPVTHWMSLPDPPNDSRTKKVQRIFDMILKEHAELKKFTAGFAKPEPCDCEICRSIRELYETMRL